MAGAGRADRDGRFRRRHRRASARELGWEPRVVARRRAASGRWRSIGRTLRRDGDAHPRRLSCSRLHGRRRRGDGAQSRPASAAAVRADRLLHPRGGADRRGDSADRDTPSACSVSRPACGGRGDVARHSRGYLRETQPQIVHTFLLTASLYGRLAAILARVPIVIGTEVNIYEQKRPVHALAERLLMARHRSRGRVRRVGARLLHPRRCTPIRRRST